MKKISFKSAKQLLKEAVAGIWHVVRQPRWTGVALLLALLISLLIYFSINFGFYGSLLGFGLSFADNLQVVWLLAESMFFSFGDDLNGVLLLLVSLLQGAALAALIFTARRNQKMDTKVVGQSGVALVAATIGLGCVPCGTSLLIPVMTLLFSSAAPSLMGAANAVVLMIALLLTVFALYKVGKVANQHRIMEEAA